MKDKLLTLILCSTLISVAHGQTARFLSDGMLVISDGARRIRIADISEPPDHVPTAPYVHVVQKRHGEYFVVVTTSRWTRGYPPKSGGGGAGEEAYVRCLHVVNGKVLESTEGRFRSWSDNREGGIDGWHGPIFTVTTDDELEDRVHANQKDIWQTITYTFDARHPEVGIKEEKGKPHE